MVFKKLLPLVIILFICFCGGCQESEPEILTTITLSNITAEEYSKIGDSNIPEGATINDLKKLYVEVKITNSEKAAKRTITIPDLFIIDRYDRVRSIAGDSTEQNNIGVEDIAESTAYVIFDSRGISEEELRNTYANSEIYIFYQLKDGDLFEKRVSIGENLVIIN